MPPMLYSSFYLQNNTEPNYKFILWINSVEQMVLERFGFYLLDIPDEDYMYFYENKFEPYEIVQIIQESNGFIPIISQKITQTPSDGKGSKKQKLNH